MICLNFDSCTWCDADRYRGEEFVGIEWRLLDNGCVCTWGERFLPELNIYKSDCPGTNKIYRQRAFNRKQNYGHILWHIRCKTWNIFLVYKQKLQILYHFKKCAQEQNNWTKDVGILFASGHFTCYDVTLATVVVTTLVWFHFIENDIKLILVV